MKQKFGDGFAIKETETGKWCILSYDANVGDTGETEKLTKDQIDNMDITLYDTEQEARNRFNEIIMNALKG